MSMFEPSPMWPGKDQHLPYWIAALQSGGGFTPDTRFDRNQAPSGAPQDEVGETAQSAISAAFEQGRMQGLAEAGERHDLQISERRKLGSRLRRMDEEMTEQLGRQLSQTIAVLCEASLAPLALDRELLAKRCVRAARLLGDNSANQVLYLHPDDIENLDDGFRANWAIKPDPQLPKGSIRIEGPDGGIGDGPAEWRAALHDVLGLEQD